MKLKMCTKKQYTEYIKSQPFVCCKYLNKFKRKSIAKRVVIYLYQVCVVVAGSPFEESKDVVTARMFSGRYKTDKLMSNRNRSNPTGLSRLTGHDG